MGNLRNPPLFLRPSVVRALVSDLHTLALTTKGVVNVPIMPAATKPAAPAPAPAPIEMPEPPLGPIAPADLDPACRSISQDGGAMPTEAAGAPVKPVRSRLPAKKSGREEDGARGDVSRSSPVSEASPSRLPPPVKASAKRGSSAPRKSDRIKDIEAAVEKLARQNTRSIDYARVAAAHKVHAARKPAAVREPTEVAPTRESCARCGIPGWKGCAHWLPFEATPANGAGL